MFFNIIAKVLGKRLKLILLNIISPMHSIFLLGQLITNNVLISFEIIHHVRNKRRGRVSEVALKIDINKAYGKVY